MKVSKLKPQSLLEMSTAKSSLKTPFRHVLFILAISSLLLDIAAGDYTTCPPGSSYRQQLVGSGGRDFRCGPATCPNRCNNLCGGAPNVRKIHCQANSGAFNIQTIFCACCCGAPPSPPPPPPRRSPPPPSPPPPSPSPPPPSPPPPSPPPPPPSPPPPSPPPPPPSPPPPSPPPPPPSPPPPSPPPPPPSPPPPSPPPPSAPVGFCSAGQISISSPMIDCSLCTRPYCGTQCPGGLTSVKKSGGCNIISNACRCCCESSSLLSSTTLVSSLFAEVE